MTQLVAISEAKDRLAEIVRNADHDDVFLTRHGRPDAVVLSARRYSDLLEEIEDLKDVASLVDDGEPTIPWDKLKAELGVYPA